MLVMLAFGGTRAQSLPADAHNARVLGVRFRHKAPRVLGVRFRHKAQLMLMMLVFGGRLRHKGSKPPS